jgi:aspartate 1-decarboxylase
VLLRSKVQRLTVTDKSLVYDGSLELDSRLLRAAGMLPGEVVQVVNLNNGQRFETYVIAGRAGSGACVLNGAAARLGEVGDKVIVMCSVLVEEPATHGHRPVLVNVDNRNRIISDRNRPRGR